MMKYLIGIDIGTSGTKSVLFDTEGNTVASATAEYPMRQPQNGWAEQDPEDWWQATAKTLKEITAYAADGEIAGLGLSGQMHSLVLLDEKNRVIRPAILWCDQRTGAECAEIEAAVGRNRLIEITANPALTGFTASKILWVKKREPALFARTAHILLAKDYIRFRLTGAFATEVSDASGMQLLDVKNRCWSEEVCQRLGINTALLAKVYESPEVTGHVTADAAAKTGLPCGLPVAGGAGDNAAAAIAMGVCRAGRAFTTVIYANFQGLDPNAETVEINVRPCCFYPKNTGVDFITLRGFEIAQGACPWAPPTAHQIGMIGPHWSRGWIIENNIIHDAKCSAVSLGKEASTGENLSFKFDRKSGHRHQLEAVFRAFAIGWSKEKIGSHTVRNNTIYDCRQNGIVGHLGCIFSRVEHNHIYNISQKREFWGHEMGVIKFHAAIDTVIADNNIHHCTLGTWLDWQAQGARVTRNVYHHNLRDFMIEVSHGPAVVDHNIFTAHYAMDNWSQGTAFVHNLFAARCA